MQSERIATLRLPEHRGVFPGLPSVGLARDSRGGYVAGPVAGDSLLAIFLPSGELHTLLGRAGSGPGEFSGSTAPMYIRAAESTRVLIFQGRELHVVDTAVPAVLERLPLRMLPADGLVIGGQVLAQGPEAGPEGGGTLVQVLGQDGSILRGIVPGAMQAAGAADPFARNRVLGRSAMPATFWAAPINRLELTRYGLEGPAQLTISRQSDWFRPYSTLLPGERFAVPQRPRVEGMVEDADGLLWVAVSEGARPFTPALAQTGAEGRLDRFMDVNGLLDTVVEVLDPSSARVLARSRLRGHWRFVSTAGSEVLLYSASPGGAVDSTIEVLQVRLLRRGTAGTR